MNALVLGGSGHIGNAIVRALLERGFEVTACGRRKAAAANLLGLPAHYVSADANDPRQLRKLVADYDVIIDSAAPYSVGIDGEGFRSSASGHPIAMVERRTRGLLEAIEEHEAQFAYIGSFVTMARPKTEAQRIEAQMIRLARPYFEAKLLIESEILNACRRGVRAAIVNPTYCLGPWDMHDRDICTIPLLISGDVPGSIRQKLNVIDVREVAAVTLTALKSERYGDSLLAAGHPIDARDLYGMICDLGGVRRPRFVTGARTTMFGAYWMELAMATLGRKTPLPAGGMMMAAYFDYQLPQSVLPEFAITSRPLEETILDALRWYRQIGYC
jgi:dihydroflavonol-4-reductase